MPEPGGFGHCVIVDESANVAAGCGNSQISGAGQVGFVETDGFDPLVLQATEALAIGNHDDLEQRMILLGKGGKTSLKPVRPVAAGDDDTEPQC